MSDNYIHSTIYIDNFEIPIFIISLKNDSQRRSLLSNFLPKEIINNYFPALDFRNKSENELEKFMDLNKLIKNEIYNRKLTGGEIGCAESHKSIYKYMEINNLPFALILEDDVVPQKKWQNKLGKVLNDLKLIGNEKALVCNIGIDYYRSTPSKNILISFIPFIFCKIIKLVNFQKTDLFLAHSYIINLKGARNILNKYKKYESVCDDWKFFYQDKCLDYVFISECIFIQNTTLNSNIRERQISINPDLNINKVFQIFISIKAIIKIIMNNINPQNWFYFRYKL